MLCLPALFYEIVHHSLDTEYDEYSSKYVVNRLYMIRSEQLSVE